MDPDKLAAALEGMSISTPVGQRTIDPETYQTDAGQLWGPMVKKPSRDYRMMDPITYLPAKIAE